MPKIFHLYVSLSNSLIDAFIILSSFINEYLLIPDKVIYEIYILLLYSIIWSKFIGLLTVLSSIISASSEGLFNTTILLSSKSAKPYINFLLSTSY